MRQGKTIQVRLYGAERRNSSVNGNPRFWLHTSEGDYATQSDAAISYEVENITHQIPQGDAGIRVVLTMTKADRVYDIKVLSPYDDPAEDADNIRIMRGGNYGDA